MNSNSGLRTKVRILGKTNLKTEQHWRTATHQALPLRRRRRRRRRQEQGGVWCDHWSSCCDVICVCWMGRHRPVAYRPLTAMTGRLFGTFEAASIKWEIIITILRCLSDLVFAYYARSSVRSCRRRWNREKTAGDGTHNNAMQLCIYVLPVPPASAPCGQPHCTRLVDATCDKFDNRWYILGTGNRQETGKPTYRLPIHKPNHNYNKKNIT